jgi:CRISPR-associated protein Cas2
MFINGYRCMWVLAMFDLPTDTKKARREYTLFRKALLRDGFTQMQYSVYARIERHLPPDGEVRVVTITDKQFERMQIFWGKMRKSAEPAPCQLSLF